MTRKEMIAEYCLVYVDVMGFMPDKRQIEKLDDVSLRVLHEQMILLTKWKEPQPPRF